jgi:hypothetical protein
MEKKIELSLMRKLVFCGKMLRVESLPVWDAFVKDPA